MGFFGNKIIRIRRLEMEDRFFERLQALSIFTQSEIEHIHLESGVPIEEILEVLEILNETKTNFCDKVIKLRKHPYGTEVLIVVATMNH